jgi:hypothetical protein
MGGMTAVLVVAAIAVVAAVIALVTWRRPGDERHSIESHQQTLDTLRSMADRRSQGRTDKTAPAPRTAGGGSADPSARARGARTQVGPVPSRPPQPGSMRAPALPRANGNGNGKAELVFGDDTSVVPEPSPDGWTRGSALTLPRGLPGQRRGHRTGRRRSRPGGRLVPVAAAVVVLGLVVGLAVALAPSHHGGAPGRKAIPPRTRAATHVRRSQTTTTTRPELQATSATSSTAAYGAPATAYTVALSATGLCWVEATEASTGKVVWTGTLLTGQTRSISSAGSLLVRLGAANDVSVTLNGEPVVLPSSFSSPFDMRFQSA